MINVTPLKYRLMTQSTAVMSLEAYHQDIKLEIECILNQRCVQYPFNVEYKHLNDSLYSYGITHDLKWAPYEKLYDPIFLNQLAQLITHHEPRLKQCKVRCLEDNIDQHQIALMIEGEVNYSNKVSHWQCVAYCQPIQRRYKLK